MTSAVATSSLSSCNKRERSSSDDSDGSIDITKRPRYFYILEPETTDYSSDEIDSVHSFQQRTTDSAKDTSDTSTKSEDSALEFEVVSNSDNPVCPFASKDSSSPPDDILSGAITFEYDERSFFYSGSDACESSSVSSGKRRSNRKLSLFKTCVQCGQANNALFYRYCDRCYKVRKNFFPPRPIGRKKRETKKMVDISKSTTDDLIRSACDSGINSAEYTPRLSEERLENCDEQGQNDRKELCGTCLIRFKDGGFVHNNIVHVYSCYRCSVKTVKQIGRCPICNVRVRQVCKVITI